VANTLSKSWRSLQRPRETTRRPNEFLSSGARLLEKAYGPEHLSVWWGTVQQPRVALELPGESPTKAEILLKRAVAIRQRSLEAGASRRGGPAFEKSRRILQSVRPGYTEAEPTPQPGRLKIPEASPGSQGAPE